MIITGANGEHLAILMKQEELILDPHRLGQKRLREAGMYTSQPYYQRLWSLNAVSLCRGQVALIVYMAQIGW
jgi:hypothetical protein